VLEEEGPDASRDSPALGKNIRHPSPVGAGEDVWNTEKS
jgi:hypothetical protein